MPILARKTHAAATNSVRKTRLMTAEAVRAGHPDKFCDQLADRLLDEYLKDDPNTRAAIEVMAADGKILVAGEGYPPRPPWMWSAC